MKILHTVESYLPLKHGMSEVVRQLSERLVRLGHEVTVATSYCSSRSENIINHVKIKSFRVEGSFVAGYTGELEAYKEFLILNEFDIITNFAAQQWATDICIELLPLISARKVFVPTGFSGLNNSAYTLYFERMKMWMKSYDMNVFLSNDYRDIKFARENNIDQLIIIPNGAAKDEFLSTSIAFDLRYNLGIPQNNKIILHVGSYTGVKGHEEALAIFLKARIQHASLVFVGANFTEKGKYFAKQVNWLKNFTFTDLLNKRFIKALLLFLRKSGNKYLKNVFTVCLERDQTVAAYKQADLFLFPSMIECSPIVLFESMASKTPFLVTQVGNASEIIDWSQGGELLPTFVDQEGFSHACIDESAELLSNLLNNPDAMNRMGNSGHSKWLQKFTWEKITEQYEEMYKKLIN